MRSWFLAVVVCVAAVGCECGEEDRGRGRTPGRDSGTTSNEDAATTDAAAADAATTDSAMFDATTADAAASDAAASDAAASDAVTLDATTLDAAAPDAATPDAGFLDATPADSGSGGVIDVRIFVANNCDVTTTPATIGVPMGTGFTVNWINLPGSASNVDIDKIDQFNQVPLIIGLEPGNSYHDTIREWCGNLFSGTFSFRITGCFDPYYLDVDCSI